MPPLIPISYISELGQLVDCLPSCTLDMEQPSFDFPLTSVSQRRHLCVEQRKMVYVTLLLLTLFPPGLFLFFFLLSTGVPKEFISLYFFL